MTASEIKLISCDLDGTLLNSSGEISSATEKVLRRIHERGILIAISSGRRLESIRQHVPSDLFDYACCLNGQDLYCAETGIHYRKECLNTDDVNLLCSLLNHSMAIMNYHDESSSVTACSPRYLLFARLFSYLQNLRWISKQMPVQKRSIVTLPLTNFPELPAKLCFCSFYSNLKRLERKIPASRFSCVFVSPQWMEVQVRGISKGESLKQIMELEHLSRNQCAAFGDGENDTEMLKAAGIGIAMRNAMPETKAAADEITLSHNQDGVAVWLDHNILNPTENI